MYLSVTQSIPELSHIVKNIEQGIVEALDAGANPDQLMYSTLIDFSKVPAALELLPKNGLLRSLGIEILKAFSYELNQNIISGILKHLPESQIMRFDELFEDLHKRPKHYGLDAKNIEHTCVELQKMPNCSGLLFFNGKHPTNLGHHIIANDIITSFGKEFLNKSVIQWIGDSLSDTGNNRYCKDRPTNVQRQNKTSKVLVDTLYNRSARETRSIRGVRPSAAMPTNTRS